MGSMVVGCRDQTDTVMERERDEIFGFWGGVWWLFLG